MSDSTPDFAPETPEISSLISSDSSCADIKPPAVLEATLHELVSRQQRWENTQVQWVERQLEWTEKLVTHVVALEEMLATRNSSDESANSFRTTSSANDEHNSEELDRLRRELAEKDEEVEFYKARAVGGISLEEDKQRDEKHREDIQRIEELEKRLDLAIGELRETKAPLAKAEADLAAKAVPHHVATPHPTPEKFANWEAQKKFLLAELNGEGGDSVSPDDRITVQQVIAATDRAIKDKEEEIKELQTLLQFRNENVTEVVVGAAAIDEILNNDEIIQQEREQLERLKKEWKEKVRTAEIEISMERAKLAREKNELEQQIEWLKVEKEKVDSQSKQNSKQNKSKWFSRLGLNE